MWARAAEAVAAQDSDDGSGGTSGPAGLTGSEYVRWLQNGLNQVFGCADCQWTASDEYAGEEGVMEFQSSRGLPVDGIVGPENEAGLDGKAASTVASRVASNLRQGGCLSCRRRGSGQYRSLIAQGRHRRASGERRVRSIRSIP